ncbi:DNA translocase FtsK [uncultured Massilia sp.]|uniref:DNA translocase FtsK n=1 Tax=uncultured Massilia sp. TaxID=169973 RepID=UPI0025D7C038|nr:DNA translocase FtsK [uncultured Massilia sp.]
MHSILRRKLLAILAAAHVVALAAPLAGRRARAGTIRPAWPPADPAEPERGAGADDPLLHPAAEWVAGMRDQGQDVLLYPISRLQRRFRIGYRRTCALMDALARRGVWAIALDAGGAPYASILPKARA